MIGTQIGILQNWNSIHGYGFFRTISPQGVFHEFFLHVSAIKDGEPIVGATATFEVGPLLKGIVPPAINVRFVPRFVPAASTVSDTVSFTVLSRVTNGGSL